LATNQSGRILGSVWEAMGKGQGKDIRGARRSEEQWLKREAARRAKAELEKAKAEENPSDNPKQ
jgi:hypothetical protein